MMTPTTTTTVAQPHVAASSSATSGDVALGPAASTTTQAPPPTTTRAPPTTTTSAPEPTTTAAPEVVTPAGASVTVVWHGREGAGGRDKSILSLPIPMRNGSKPGFAAAPQPGRKAHELKLQPGVNRGIAAADWAEAEKNALVRHFIESGCLVVQQ